MTRPFSLGRYPATDIALAKKRCKAVLDKRHANLASLDEQCILSIVIPAYDEQVKRIKAQVEAFNAQTIDPKHVELVYVVNNASRETTSPSVLKNNDTVLSYLKKAKSKMPIIVIDRSTKGNELPIGNVGHARNEGVHAVAARYLAQNRDGIIFQSDADTVPVKKTLLTTIVKDYTVTKAIGASGGVKFVLSMDSQKKSELAFFKKHLTAFNQFSRWGYLLRALTANPKDLTPAVWPTRFSGANMSSLAIATICAGGVPTLHKAVDVVFGQNLETYAKKRKAKILARRDEWIMETSFRESTRTGSGFGSSFDAMRKSKGQPMVPPFDAPPFHTFLEAFLKQRKTAQERIEALTDAGLEFTNEQNKIVKQYRATLSRPKRLAFETLVHKIYRLQYPLIKLTPQNYRKLKSLVDKDPKRRAYAENSIKYFSTFYLN